MTIPSIVPYSSITIAMCCFVRLNSVRSATRPFVSGTIVAGRSSSATLTRGDPALVHRGDQVADVEDADDLVERVAVDGVARVGRVEHEPQRLLRRELDRERDHVGPRDHHVGDVLVGEVEHLVDHLLLAALDLALLGRAREQHPQLDLGMRRVLGAGHLLAERLQHVLGRALQEPDERLEEDEEPAHGRRHRKRDPLRVAERDPLRDELADHDVQVGDDQQREDHGEDRRQRRLEQVREHLLAEGADTE